VVGVTRPTALVTLAARWVPVVVWTLAIFGLSARPYTAYFRDLESPGYRLLDRYLQYPLHLAEYAVLAGLWVRALRPGPLTGRGVACLTLAATLVTALVDESIQSLVPTRSFALRDLLMDATGSLLGVAVARWIFPSPAVET